MLLPIFTPVKPVQAGAPIKIFRKLLTPLKIIPSFKNKIHLKSKFTKSIHTKKERRKNRTHSTRAPPKNQTTALITKTETKLHDHKKTHLRRMDNSSAMANSQGSQSVLP